MLMKHLPIGKNTLQLGSASSFAVMLLFCDVAAIFFPNSPSSVLHLCFHHRMVYLVKNDLKHADYLSLF